MGTKFIIIITLDLYDGRSKSVGDGTNETTECQENRDIEKYRRKGMNGRMT